MNQRSKVAVLAGALALAVAPAAASARSVDHSPADSGRGEWVRKPIGFSS